MILRNISKSFDDKKVLDNFSYEFKKAEKYTIMGKSGCGKTTLFNIICGLLKQDSGTVSKDENSISAVFQEDRLCERLSAYANVRLVCNKNISKEQIISDFNKVGLSETDIFKPASELSGGMKRRTAIVRALISEHDFVIMDEPFKGLDEDTRKKTVDYVVSRTENSTLVVITHNSDDTVIFGKNIIEM